MNGRKMPSPALVIAVLALFVSLSGTAVAAGVVPLAKRALTADNSKKLGGQTADAIAASAAQRPGPASSAAGLFTVKSTAWSLGPNGRNDFAVMCDRARRRSAAASTIRTDTRTRGTRRPTGDGAGWRTVVGLRPTRRARRTAPSTPSACAEVGRTCNAGSRSRSQPSRWGEGSAGARRREWGLPRLAPTPISAPGRPRRLGSPGPVLARRRHDRPTGEHVRVEVSDAYPPEAVSAQAWADFFARPGARAGAREVTVRVGTPLDVLVECGLEALACYNAGILVLPGELGRHRAGGARPPRVRPPRRREPAEPTVARGRLGAEALGLAGRRLCASGRRHRVADLERGLRTASGRGVRRGLPRPQRAPRRQHGADVVDCRRQLHSRRGGTPGRRGGCHEAVAGAGEATVAGRFAPAGRSAGSSR